MLRTHSAKAGDADSELLVRHVKYILKEKVERVFGTYQMTISYLLNKRSWSRISENGGVVCSEVETRVGC